MRLAKFIGEDDNPCYSRQIGAVITTEDGRRILGTGYNGPPPGTPHTDSIEYLEQFFWPLLTVGEVDYLRYKYGLKYATAKEEFIQLAANKKLCPRRYLNHGAGVRNELCTCGHAERHAITNAATDLKRAIMFCWCGTPCLQCADAIIQAGIKTVHCLNTGEYHKGTNWLFAQAGVKIIQHDEEYFIN